MPQPFGLWEYMHYSSQEQVVQQNGRSKANGIPRDSYFKTQLMTVQVTTDRKSCILMETLILAMLLDISALRKQILETQNHGKKVMNY